MHTISISHMQNSFCKGSGIRKYIPFAYCHSDFHSATLAVVPRLPSLCDWISDIFLPRNIESETFHGNDPGNASYTCWHGCLIGARCIPVESWHARWETQLQILTVTHSIHGAVRSFAIMILSSYQKGASIDSWESTSKSNQSNARRQWSYQSDVFIFPVIQESHGQWCALYQGPSFSCKRYMDSKLSSCALRQQCFLIHYTVKNIEHHVLFMVC